MKNIIISRRELFQIYSIQMVGNLNMNNNINSNNISQNNVIYDNDTEITRETFKVNGAINAIAWSHDEVHIAVLSNSGGTLSIYSTKNKRVISEYNKYGDAYAQNSLEYLADDSIITTSSIRETTSNNLTGPVRHLFSQWNSNTGNLIRNIPDTNIGNNLMVSQIGPCNTFTVSNSSNIIAGITGTSIYLYDADNQIIKTRIDISALTSQPDFFKSVSISQDGTRVAAGMLSGWVYVCNAANGHLDQSFRAFDGRFNCICSSISFSPDCKYIAVGRGGLSLRDIDDGWVKIFDMSNQAVVAKFEGGTGNVRKIAWSLNGNYLAAGDDGGLRKWARHDSKAPFNIQINIRQPCYSLAFSRSDRLASSHGNRVNVF